MFFQDVPKDLQEIISKAFDMGIYDGGVMNVKYLDHGVSWFPRNHEAYDRDFTTPFQVEAWDRGVCTAITGKGTPNPKIG